MQSFWIKRLHFNQLFDALLPLFAVLEALSDRIVMMFGGEVMGIVNNAQTSIEELGLMMAGEKLAAG